MCVASVLGSLVFQELRICPTILLILFLYVHLFTMQTGFIYALPLKLESIEWSGLGHRCLPSGVVFQWASTIKTGCGRTSTRRLQYVHTNTFKHDHVL